MKIKNIFFGLCASMMVASEISAMQLVTKRVPKSMHRVNTMGPMLQKRSMNGSEVLGALMMLPGICIIFGIHLLAGCAIVGAVGGGALFVVGSSIVMVVDYKAMMRNRKAAYEYINQLDEC